MAFQNLDQYEQGSMAALAAEAQNLEALLSVIGTTGTPSSSQIQGFLNERNAILGRLFAARSTANELAAKARNDYGQRLEALIERVQYNVQTQQFALRSRLAFEAAMGGSPTQDFVSSPDRRRSGPDYFASVMGWQCFWCKGDLRNFPQPLAICPHCGRVPKPPST
jgi:hypothetical protein